MSDDRKILSAKRKNERNPNRKFKETPNLPERKGVKRCNETPKKNLASDRMKRLRTSLNEEVQKTSTPVTKCDSTRKRPQGLSEQTVAPKIPKQEEKPYVFSTEVKQRVFGISDQPNPFAVSNLAPQSSNECIEDMEWSTNDEDSVEAPTSTKTVTTSYKNGFYIVVDTNIFLSNLQTIKNIVNMDAKGDSKPIIYIPWIVIEELDFIKEDSNKTNLKFKAQEAIKYVERNLSGKNERMLGQTLEEVNEQKNTGKSQDNKIIGCCLQVLEKCQNMILLTNDINLRNKAHFNHIPVCSNSEIMSKVSHLFGKKSDLVLDKMTSLCVLVIEKCAKSAYGEASSKMPICQPPPRSLQDCIGRFTKYWFAVFQEILMKQFKKSIEDLSNFLNKHQNIGDRSNELSDLVRLCVRVCLFLKDVDSCRDTIENTIRDLNNIKES